MKKKSVLLMCCLVGLSLTAAEFTLNSGAVKAVFDTRGGGIKQLSFKGRELLRHKGTIWSFTEKVLRSEGKKQIIEDFSTLEFTPVTLDKNSIVLNMS